MTTSEELASVIRATTTPSRKDGEGGHMLTNEYQRFAHPDERERLGREIDETADVLILGRRAGVPYGDDMDPKWDGYGSHKTWYAVTPDGIAVCFGDIPDETCKALEEKVGRRHLSREEAADLPY